MIPLLLISVTNNHVIRILLSKAVLQPILFKYQINYLPLLIPDLTLYKNIST